ncbi:Helix-turn-helix domain protein [Actinomadura rubteroloni]|uniref:Helix-turn-helix domain protein n=1 Tax=Actinomadura rubteroloni TaxID=1926885 RepID=A0A2P4UI03_9ACTN|nr:helix-turn-helix transcriptional regulator [Actinomadura rubteroloni]POM24673.1 Helix-turn-helix domain protein [Actinomadura rubteroloni]
MSVPAEDAKRAFGARLRGLRKAKGLSGLELAGLTGIPNWKISRIEGGKQGVKSGELAAWCRACGADEQYEDLVIVQSQVHDMWVEWKRELRKGQKLLHENEDALYRQTKLLIVYESKCVPGILQTHGYVFGLFKTAEALYGLPEREARAAADARLPKQSLVTAASAKNGYHFVIEPWVLELVFGDVNVMLEQLTFLSAVTLLPNVSLGIIPPGATRAVPPGEPFYMFDGSMVRSPMWSAGFKTSRPEEIDTFKRAFNLLRGMAVYGAEARELIEQARQKLQTSANL